MSQSINQINNQLVWPKFNDLFWVGGQWAGINFAIFMENYFGSKSTHYNPGKIKGPRTCPDLKNFQKLTTFPNSLGWECQLGGRRINCNTWQLPFAFPVHQLPLFPLPTIIPLLFALIISITTFTKKEVKLVSLQSQPYWLLARKTSQLINKPSIDGCSTLVGWDWNGYLQAGWDIEHLTVLCWKEHE